MLALQENNENVLFLMDSIINSETSDIESTGLELPLSNANVETVRTQFDSKWRSYKVELVVHSATCALPISSVRECFPINRFIRDAINLFAEVNGEEFLTLPSYERFNLTHKPISD